MSEVDSEPSRVEATGTRSKSRRVASVVAFVLALGAAAWLGWWLGRWRAQPQTAATGISAESSAEGTSSEEVYRSFRLPSLDGGVLGPADLDASVVVLDFWATWCAPCEVQAEILRPIQADYGARGVGFLGVNLGEEEAVVRRYVEREPFPYPTLLDEDAAVSDAAGVVGLPTVVVLDRAGEVLLESVGLVGATQLRAVLDRALAE